ncbi:alpha-E domain-containing protein [Exilibacterium tricleocarpae]|uniref:Alpha-E domain-containing protein n=1 Tax=Exilibacterium tricleocarpae TaxID=2591008 RepID=A0A545U6U5_9GAMM|nr:alpha-E domain-containing protein [Exilibacterium tricleocarpae]TQV85164.1 alpha-E domain-containing protein [Exilibacterium tricleocarpae]
MLSRVAQRLYWFARYMERTENTARLMLVRHQLILDLPAAIQPEWELLVNVLGASENFEKTQRKPTEKNVIAYVFGDRDNPGSIISSIANARENIRTTREVITSETWERVNSLYLSVAQRSNRELPRGVRHKVLNGIIQSCQQVVGLLAGTMNHDEAYQLLRLGRNLERADMSTRIVDAGSAELAGEEEDVQPYRNVLWISVLQSLSAYQMYRLNIRRNVKSSSVLNFLLKSEVFPRATAHNLSVIAACIDQLPHNKQALKVVTEVKTYLAETDMRDLAGMALHEFIDTLQVRLDSIHEVVNATWFEPEVSG